MGRKVKSKRPDLLDAVIDGDHKKLHQLLRQGIDPNIRDTAGWTALHFAAQRQNATMIQALLDAGADVDSIDGYGNTPLSCAVFSSKGLPKAIKALQAAGADENKANNSGVSPRSLAMSIANYDILSILDQ